ncbi:MAG: dihydrolipoamide acetyltransferase family protein [Actinomycetota bacterium]
MATIVRMPEVLANATEAAIQGWLVAEGDTITVGQPLAEIETEKAMVEYNSEVAGVLVRLLVGVGDSVDVGAPIGVIAAAGEVDVDVAALLAGEAGPAPAGAPVLPPDEATALESEDSHAEAAGVLPSAPDGSPISVPAVSQPAGAEPPPLRDTDRRRFASPLVRRLARERSLDLGSVVGSGPNGRIVRRDLDGHAASGATPAAVPAVAVSAVPVSAAPGSGTPAVPVSAAPAVAAPAVAGQGFTDVPHTGMRRAIARRLTKSKSSVPHFYVTADCRVDRLLALRGEINASAPRKISVNDFVVKGVAAALLDVPAANATWGEESMRHFDYVDLSVAVATAGGLLTPVLRGVDTLSLSAISTSIADLAERARAGKLRQQELEGGSFAVTNLGMFGVDEFSAILNPPQSGILAVGAAKQRAVVEGGQIVAGTLMTVTLSADHRVIDGAVAAEWLAAFVRRIENPLSMLV